MILRIGDIVFDPKQFAAIAVSIDPYTDWQKELWAVWGHLAGKAHPIYLSGPFATREEAVRVLNTIMTFVPPADIAVLNVPKLEPHYVHLQEHTQ